MKNIYEIFEEFEKAPTEADKLAVLRKNDCYALRQILKGTYDPGVEFAIERVPYYKPSDAPPGMGYTSINAELHRTYLFQKAHPKLNPDLTPDRREKILIQILEALEAREAEVYMNMIMKREIVKDLTVDLVKKAYPELW